jgi:molybdopterin synthase catalytic subunit
MALKITPASEPIATETMVVTIFGQPGIGKTSIAFSASRPLLFDFDGGAQRAVGRRDTVRVRSWDDVASIEAEDVAPFDTLIIDTVGRALEFLAVKVIAGDPKLGRKTGELTMQGYGALKTAFASWLSRVRTFGKNVILIAHEKEEKNGDETIVRVDAMGATRTEVIRLSDLVGFVSADSKGGTLDFNPTDRHTGKNCVGFDVLRVPDLRKEPAWFAGIVREALDTMNAKTEEQREAEKRFADALAKIEAAETVEAVMDLLREFAGDKVLTTAVHKRALGLGFVPNKATKSYEPAPEKTDEPAGETAGEVAAEEKGVAA